MRNMTILVLDTHVLLWLTAEPERLSPAASLAIGAADELVVASITWFELAWLAVRGRIELDIPLHRWLTSLGGAVRTAGLTPSIAATAASLPSGFPGDPADRIIRATASEHGWPLVSKDGRMRTGDLAGSVIW
jgi:PIN domain nuclease of toxin-antitoxin system